MIKEEMRKKLSTHQCQKILQRDIIIFADVVKFIQSEKVTNFCETSTVDLSKVVTVKSTVEISQNFVPFSEYMNFTYV